ncbi:MAG: MATE family efflux transporter [Lachnospiraceae bacterium]|nr:MATE family efflux transporter [Candidatus Minthocola equi]
MFKSIDFRSGNAIKNLILFAIPLMLGQLLQNLYNTVDALVVGNFNGDAELAAVSVCSTSSNVIVGFFVGISVGAGVVASKAFGFGDKNNLNRTVKIIITFGVALGLIASCIGVLLVRPMLDLSGARPDYYDKAYLYLIIFMAGVIFTCAYNFCAGTLRAIGNSTATLVILAVSGVINVGLDLLFTGLLGWGVAGVAIATVIAQAVSFVIGVILICRNIGEKCFDIPLTFRNGGKVIKETLSIGVATGMQSAIISFSNTIIFRYINMFDTAAVSGFGVGSKLDHFALIPLDCLGSAVSTGVGQNIGAGKFERIKPIVYDGLIITTAASMLFGGTMLILARPLVGLFTDNPATIAAGTQMVRTLTPLYWISAVRYTLAGALRAYGKSFWPSATALFAMVGVRQLFLAIVMTNPKIDYVFWCYPVGWIAASIFILIYYLLVRKELKGLGQ